MLVIREQRRKEHDGASLVGRTPTKREEAAKVFQAHNIGEILKIRNFAY